MNRTRQHQPLRLNMFAGLNSWPIYVMAEKKLLAGAGYDLVMQPTTGSVAQVQSMLQGDADIALTALDNVVAYDIGQGDPSLPSNLDFRAFLHVGFPALSLLARPEIGTIADLREKTFAVDAPGTGFSFVLRRMLQAKGIQPGEYSFMALGATNKRFEAMVAGQCAAALVAAPFDVLGVQQHGFRSLGTLIDVLGHYDANVVMARASWLDANRNAAAAFVGAYRGATAWLYDPRNATEAIEILVRNAGLPPAIVTQVAPGILKAPASYSHDGRFDDAGVKMVLDLRATYGTPKTTIGEPSQFIDARFV